MFSQSSALRIQVSYHSLRGAFSLWPPGHICPRRLRSATPCKTLNLKQVKRSVCLPVFNWTVPFLNVNTVDDTIVT